MQSIDCTILNRYKDWVSNEVGKLGFGCVLVTVYSQAAGITCLGKYMLTTSFTLFLSHGKIIEEKF